MKIPAVPQGREEEKTLFSKMKRAFVGTIIILKICPNYVVLSIGCGKIFS